MQVSDRKQQVVSLLLALLASAAWGEHHHQNHKAPDWLIGLSDLLPHHQQRDGQQSVTGSILSAADGASPRSCPGQLLRPKAQPALAHHQATLQQSGNPTQQQVTLESVAHNYGIARQHLQQMMQQDPGLLVSQQGLLVWSCHGDARSPDDDQATELSNTPGSNSSSTSSASANAGQAHRSGEDAGAGAYSRLVGTTSTTARDEPHASATDYLPFLRAALPLSAPDKEVALMGAQDVDADTDTNSAGHTAFVQGVAGALTDGHAQGPGASVVPQPGLQPQDASKLHSQPTGTCLHTIFLNFRGCTITNTHWNTATKKAVLQTDPYDLDGDPSTFSQQEQQAMVSIWQAVAEDFAPWAVDVTTEDPGEDALLR